MSAVDVGLGSEDDQKQFMAAVEMTRRAGATAFEVRYSEGEGANSGPTVWMAIATYPGERWEVAAGRHAKEAVERLLTLLINAGVCSHCGKPTCLDTGWRGTGDAVCWYQYDPEHAVYRRGCE